KIMKATNRYNDKRWNRSLLTYYFHNGSYIEFFSADQEDKVRGPRRNILYINECNNINFETYHQLAIRTDREIWLDYNPTHEFWIHTELGDDEDSEQIILTYKDNEALSDSIVKEIEKALHKGFHNISLPFDQLFSERNIKNSYWSNWWRVYGLGLVGSLEGVIFSNWKQIGDVPKDAKLLGYGMDFGFTNYPTTLVAVYQYNSSLVIDELIYRTGMLNSDIIRELKMNNVSKSINIWADSAEPKTIEEIRRSGGFNIRGVDKGKDSVNFGIDILQQYELLITSRSTNAIKEIRSYCWDQDKTGKKINKPIDAFNHIMDAMRYFAMMTFKKRQEYWGVIGGK